MSKDVDLYVYNEKEIVAKLMDLERVEGEMEEPFIRKILATCGVFIGDKYIHLNNEMWSDQNPHYNLIALLDAYIGDCVSQNAMYAVPNEDGITYVDLDSTAGDLGITIEDRFME